MSFLDRIRNALAGPPRIQGGGDEGAMALDEEYGTPDQPAPDVRQPAGEMIGPGSRGAKTVEVERKSEEAPPDPIP